MSTELRAIQDSASAESDVDGHGSVWRRSTILQHHNRPIAEAKATVKALTRKERANKAISEILILMDAYSDLSSTTRLSTEAKNKIAGALNGTNLLTKADFDVTMRIGLLKTRKKVLKAMTQAKEELLQRDKVHFWKAEIKRLKKEKRLLEISRDIREARDRVRKGIWLVNIVRVCLVLSVIACLSRIYWLAVYSQPSQVCPRSA